MEYQIDKNQDFELEKKLTASDIELRVLEETFAYQEFVRLDLDLWENVMDDIEDYYLNSFSQKSCRNLLFVYLGYLPKSYTTIESFSPKNKTEEGAVSAVENAVKNVIENIPKKLEKLKEVLPEMTEQYSRGLLSHICYNCTDLTDLIEFNMNQQIKERVVHTLTIYGRNDAFYKPVLEEACQKFRVR